MGAILVSDRSALKESRLGRSLSRSHRKQGITEMISEVEKSLGTKSVSVDLIPKDWGADEMKGRGKLMILMIMMRVGSVSSQAR